MTERKSLRVALGQMTSADRMQENLDSIYAMIAEAAAQGARLVVFPENSVFMRLKPGAKLETFDIQGAQAQHIGELARKHNLHVMLTTPVVRDAHKSVNATVYWRPGAAATIAYSKIHLFDVEVDGAPPVRESDYFYSGEKPSIVTVDDWHFGLSICYDLRFAELYASYQGKVDAILIPSAFLVPTGEAHWHILNRARAIENQCYVLAPAQSGEHRSDGGVTRKTYGHSLAVDPWGRVIVDADEGPGIRIVNLEADKINWVRKQIPMHSHRRLKSF